MKGLFIISLLWATQGFAQMPWMPERSLEVPKITSQNYRTFQETPVVPEVDMLATTGIDPEGSAQELKKDFEASMAFLQKPKPACSSAQSADYILALQVGGRFQDCIEYAQDCAKDNALYSSRVISLGAQCAATQYSFEQAHKLYSQAASVPNQSSSDLTQVLFEWASFAMYGIYEDQVDAILKPLPESTLWKALILRAGSIELPAGISKEQVDQFLVKKISETQGTLQALLKSVKIRIAYIDYKYDQALVDLKNEGASLNNPLLWYDLLHNVLYYGLDRDYKKSRTAYDVYDQYSNPWSKFPVENNTYNYTEIYNQVCRNQLLQGSDYQKFSNFKSQIREGHLSPQKALEQVQGWVEKYPMKADVLTTYGGLLSLMGEHDEAFGTYWKAHKICRHYHRANWGLTLEKRYFRYSRMPDYKKNEARVKEELKSRVIPKEISSYIQNWNSLNSDVQERVAYGARIWLPLMKDLKDISYFTYIKYAFDLLSESPGRSELRDLRIGGPNYPHDNRLWDDVRGVGGTFVVADLSEVFQTVQGDYNLLGHEMAHQVHYFFETASPASARCIDKFYAKAQKENNFPDGYSAYNTAEHFAQGATYYMIPEDSPKRFGLNRSWLVKNNPQQLAFIESIEKAQGHLNQIVCPLD